MLSVGSSNITRLSMTMERGREVWKCRCS